MYYFELSVDLETAEDFCSSCVSSGLLLKGKELFLFQQKKREKCYSCPINFTNESISCLVGFLSFCLHSVPKPKPCLAVRQCYLGLCLRKPHSGPPLAILLLAEQKRHHGLLIPTCTSKMSQAHRTPEFPAQVAHNCFCGHRMQPCLENHPIRQAHLEEPVLRYAP